MEKESKKVRRDLEPDGKASVSDSLESNSQFEDEYHDMSEEFFEKENPGYHALLKRVQGAHKKPD